MYSLLTIHSATYLLVKIFVVILAVMLWLLFHAAPVI